MENKIYVAVSAPAPPSSFMRSVVYSRGDGAISGPGNRDAHSKQKDTGKPREKIPRPLNAFLLFANEHRRLFRNKFPLCENKDISTMLGDAWRALPDSKKSPYFAKAKELEKEHKLKYPDYQYFPSRSNKRRNAFHTEEEYRRFKRRMMQQATNSSIVTRCLNQNHRLLQPRRDLPATGYKPMKSHAAFINPAIQYKSGLNAPPPLSRRHFTQPCFGDAAPGHMFHVPSYGTSSAASVDPNAPHVTTSDKLGVLSSDLSNQYYNSMLLTNPASADSWTVQNYGDAAGIQQIQSSEAGVQIIPEAMRPSGIIHDQDGRTFLNLNTNPSITAQGLMNEPVSLADQSGLVDGLEDTSDVFPHIATILNQVQQADLLDLGLPLMELPGNYLTPCTGSANLQTTCPYPEVSPSGDGISYGGQPALLTPAVNQEEYVQHAMSQGERTAASSSTEQKLNPSRAEGHADKENVAPVVTGKGDKHENSISQVNGSIAGHGSSWAGDTGQKLPPVTAQEASPMELLAQACGMVYSRDRGEDFDVKHEGYVDSGLPEGKPGHGAHGAQGPLLDKTDPTPMANEDKYPKYTKVYGTASPPCPGVDEGADLGVNSNTSTNETPTLIERTITTEAQAKNSDIPELTKDPITPFNIPSESSLREEVPNTSDLVYSNAHNVALPNGISPGQPKPVCNLSFDDLMQKSPEEVQNMLNSGKYEVFVISVDEKNGQDTVLTHLQRGSKAGQTDRKDGEDAIEKNNDA